AQARRHPAASDIVLLHNVMDTVPDPLMARPFVTGQASAATPDSNVPPAETPGSPPQLLQSQVTLTPSPAPVTAQPNAKELLPPPLLLAGSATLQPESGGQGVSGYMPGASPSSIGLTTPAAEPGLAVPTTTSVKALVNESGDSTQADDSDQSWLFFRTNPQPDVKDALGALFMNGAMRQDYSNGHDRDILTSVGTDRLPTEQTSVPAWDAWPPEDVPTFVSDIARRTRDDRSWAPESLGEPLDWRFLG